jgi:hypothetical protein
MKTLIKAISLAVALLAPLSFAQESSSSANELSSAVESSSSEDAFASIMDQKFAPEDDASSAAGDGETEALATTASSSSAAEESSFSSGDGGLVLIGAESSSSERMVYGRDAPVYTFVVTAGIKSPSRGIVSLEYVVAQEIFNVGVHFTDYTEDIFQVGISLIYYPMESRYFYTFLTSEWIHGEYDRERDIGTGVYKEYTETVNYWRVVLGIGAEVLFVKHFGAYVEAGFEFFAGDGSYYTNLNKEYGYLDNNKIVLPLGIGLTFPF